MPTIEAIELTAQATSDGITGRKRSLQATNNVLSGPTDDSPRQAEGLCSDGTVQMTISGLNEPTPRPHRDMEQGDLEGPRTPSSWSIPSLDQPSLDHLEHEFNAHLEKYLLALLLVQQSRVKDEAPGDDIPILLDLR